MGFSLHRKRLIENIELNAPLIIIEDEHSHGHRHHTHTHTHTHCISKHVSMYSLRVTLFGTLSYSQRNLEIGVELITLRNDYLYNYIALHLE